jgi:hypothetical protein
MIYPKNLLRMIHFRCIGLTALYIGYMSILSSCLESNTLHITARRLREETLVVPSADMGPGTLSRK